MESHNNLNNKINKENSIHIQPGEIVFTTAEAKRPIIGNAHAPICVNMAVYSPNTKTLAFAHFEPFSVDYAEQAFEQIHTRLGDADQLKVYFGSGIPRTEGNNLYQKLFALASEKQWHIEKEIDASSMAFDSRTGELFDHVDKEQLGELDIPRTARAKKRWQSAEYGSRELHIVFDAIENPKSEKVTEAYAEFFHSENEKAPASFQQRLANFIFSFWGEEKSTQQNKVENKDRFRPK